MIPFPSGGINRRVAYQESDPQTTCEAINVFLDDPASGRSRGGSRKGVEKRFADPVDTRPTFIEVVTTELVEGEGLYQVLVVGTFDNLYVSSPTKIVGVGGYPVTYEEVLVPASGNFATEAGDQLVTEGGDAIVISDFALGNVPRGRATTYQTTVLIGSNGETVVSGSGTISSGVLTSGAVSDWSAEGVVASEQMIEITDHSTAGTNRTYLITSVSSGNLTINGSPADGACSFKIIETVKQFSPSESTVNPVTPSAGFIPTGALSVAIYRDRAVWAVGRIWYMSRQGDIGDYDYSADASDAGRAVAGTVSDAGQPGDPIIAMAPGGYDYLVMFSEDTTWVLRGDPAYGGQVYNLSRSVGCVDTEAWCHGENGEIYFLSKSGLYVIAPNVAQPPKPLSRAPLPRELKTADRDNFSATLVYDPGDNTVVIFVTPNDDSEGEHWRYDLGAGSFWKIKFADNSHQPVEAISFSGVPTQGRQVVMACVDRYVRRMWGTDDDGTAIASDIILGPYKLSEDWSMESLLNEITTILDTDSGAVTLGIYAHDSGEEAAEAAKLGTSPSYEIAIGGGRSNTIRPRVRSAAVCFRLSSSSYWAFEGMHLVALPAGMRRV